MRKEEGVAACQEATQFTYLSNQAGHLIAVELIHVATVDINGCHCFLSPLQKLFLKTKEQAFLSLQSLVGHPAGSVVLGRKLAFR